MAVLPEPPLGDTTTMTLPVFRAGAGAGGRGWLTSPDGHAGQSLCDDVLERGRGVHDGVGHHFTTA